MDAIFRILALLFIGIFGFFAYFLLKIFFVPLVIIIGALYFFHTMKKILPVKSSIFSGKLTMQSLFMQTTFAVMGHISKAKGATTKDDIGIAQALMEQLNLDDEHQQLARSAFHRGKVADFPLKTALDELRESQGKGSHLLRFFLQVQMQMALTDGKIEAREEQILRMIAHSFNISDFIYQQMLAMVIASMNFRGNFQGAWQEEFYSQGHRHSNQYRGDRLNDAYKLLGLSESDDQITVKRAYRKLMNEHHPDKLAAKGLPPEMMRMAKEKAQEIQAAYDLICKHRGWR